MGYVSLFLDSGKEDPKSERSFCFCGGGAVDKGWLRVRDNLVIVRDGKVDLFTVLCREVREAKLCKCRICTSINQLKSAIYIHTFSMYRTRKSPREEVV